MQIKAHSQHQTADTRKQTANNRQYIIVTKDRVVKPGSSSDRVTALRSVSCLSVTASLPIAFCSPPSSYPTSFPAPHIHETHESTIQSIPVTHMLRSYQTFSFPGAPFLFFCIRLSVFSSFCLPLCSSRCDPLSPCSLCVCAPFSNCLIK